MSKSSLSARSDARRRIAAQRAAEAHRRRMVTMASAAVAVVVLAVTGLVAARATRTTASAAPAPSAVAGSGTVPASLMAQVAGVSAATLDRIGTGQVDQPPIAIKNAPALSTDGKPEVLYIGAEYCPYCAAERWPMVLALSRFGTFHNLRLTHSASGDVERRRWTGREQRPEPVRLCGNGTGRRRPTRGQGQGQVAAAGGSASRSAASRLVYVRIRVIRLCRR